MEELKPDALEQAARAVHECYFGRGTWTNSDTKARSNARQAVRLALASFDKNGYTLTLAANAESGNDSALARRPGQEPDEDEGGWKTPKPRVRR